MFDLSRLLRDNIRNLKPYSSAREEHSSGGILLDANENSFGAAWSETDINRYPDPLQRRLKQEIAGLKAVAPEQIFLGNGSDEAIDLLIRAFCRPGVDRIITCPPTYGMYSVCAAVNAVEVCPVPLDENFQLRAEKILETASAESKILFLCSPNNPSGNCLDTQAIETILQQFPGLAALDEAYIDFCPERSWLPALQKYPNLVILQTFSKAWGLAGLRLGMAFASPEIIRILNSIKFPYNVNTLTQRAVLAAMERRADMQEMVAQMQRERERLAEALDNLPLVEKVYPSRANFLLVRLKKAVEVYQFLQREGILVRDRTREPGCEDCLRFTVGTPPENNQLLAKLNQFSGGL